MVYLVSVIIINCTIYPFVFQVKSDYSNALYYYDILFKFYSFPLPHNQSVGAFISCVFFSRRPDASVLVRAPSTWLGLSAVG